ncbi:hypothetical protein Tco_1301921 [Tanacetum coccineum]
MGRVITIAASLDATHDSDNIIRTQTAAMPNVDIPQGMDTGGSLKRQDTMEGAPAQTRSKRVLEKSNKLPLSEGHTFGSGEARDNTPGSDEGRMELIKELMETCTSLTKRVLALVEAKTAQDSRRLFKDRVETSTDTGLGEDASKQEE